MKYLSFVLILMINANSYSQDAIPRLSGLEINADNDAPQVTHIIPWQNPKGAERLYSPIRGSNIQRLVPMDPYQFELEVSLYKQWQNNKKMQRDVVQN